MSDMQQEVSRANGNVENTSMGENVGRLKKLLEDGGLQYKIPLTQLKQLLTDKTRQRVDNSSGMRDQRGEESLLPPIFQVDSKPTEGILPIVFIGNAHYPLLQQMAMQHGFSTLITSAVSTENLANLNQYSDDDTQNGYASILERAKYYKSEDVANREGYPMVVVGDWHGKSYEAQFPESEELKKLGIKGVNVYVEDIAQALSPEEALHRLEGGFWGKAKLASYCRKLQSVGIQVVVRGIEPLRNDSFGGMRMIGSRFTPLK